MSEAATTTKKPEIAMHVKSLAELIKSDMKVDKATGTITVGDDLYARSLPEGLSKEVVEQVQSHNAAFAAAGALATGETAIPLLKKNKELENVTLNIPTVGKDAFEFGFERSRMVPNGAEGMKEKHGITTVKFSMYGVGARGELKKVKEHLADQALDAFGS